MLRAPSETGQEGQRGHLGGKRGTGQGREEQVEDAAPLQCGALPDSHPALCDGQGVAGPRRRKPVDYRSGRMTVSSEMEPPRPLEKPRSCGAVVLHSDKSKAKAASAPVAASEASNRGWSEIEVTADNLIEDHPSPSELVGADVCVMAAAYPTYALSRSGAIGWRGEVTHSRGGASNPQVCGLPLPPSPHLLHPTPTPTSTPTLMSLLLGARLRQLVPPRRRGRHQTHRATRQASAQGAYAPAARVAAA